MRSTVSLLTLAVAVTFSSHGFAQTQAEPQYGIKEEQEPTGSHIRQYSVPPINIPINRAYAELSPEDKVKWCANYESMKDGDEPPFPADGLKAILEPLTKVQQKLLVSGELFLIATIDKNGEAQKVKSIGSPSHEMTQLAARILFLTKYKAAVCSGKPCQMDFPLRLKFSVK